MYERSALMFLYCVSPLHMGAGTALGAIDNPIQRERHTRHPMIVGSGIKGALRHACAARPVDNGDGRRLSLVFGPETERSSEHAGALSVGDAQIVCFPVRSLKQTFVYATCPTALARLQRLAAVAFNGMPSDFPKRAIPQVAPDAAVVLHNELLSQDGLVLEAFRFARASSGEPELREFAEWIAAKAVPSQPAYFSDKLRKHLVLLHDDWFNHFVQHATVVEPHVRINDASGTADEGGLFYTENLPPESLLVSLLMASRSRRESKQGQSGTQPDEPPPMTADEVLKYVGRHTETGWLQLGGDATTGRGQVVVRIVRPEAKEK
ncbi:MAG: type III-B CRISPR module RAMP protein Cmr4 [Armatimonadota bacterium]|nr:type III-B CRISPR module RAMP protein Cmr4 [Armatimonadota bacterium]